MIEGEEENFYSLALNINRLGNTYESISMTMKLTQCLGSSICSGSIAQDREALKEKQLSKRYGVSRVVVREAIKMLQAKGLVETHASIGTQVLKEEHWNLFDNDVLLWILQGDFSFDLVKEFKDARAPFLCKSSMLSAKKASNEDLTRIEQALVMLKKSKKRSIDHLASEVNFNQILLKSTNNRVFLQLSKFIEVSSIYVEMHRQLVDRAIPNNYKDYESLFQLIVDGKSVEACEAMKRILVGYDFH